MTTGRLLADWVTELCDADRAPTAAEVFLHAAASLPGLGALPTGFEGTLIEGCRVIVRDDSPFDGTPTPPDWLFAHPEQFDAAPGPGPAVLIHRHADGSVCISADRDDHDRDRPATMAGPPLVDGDAAAALVTQAGLVRRLATAGVALGAVSEEIGQQIDTGAASAAAEQWNHRREYDALATTERFFQYTAALAALLAACQSVTTGRGGAAAVASTELLVTALAGSGPRGRGPALDPAWAQAELASACR